MKKRDAVTMLLAMALWTGCSSGPATPAEKPQPKAAEFITGRAAFQKLYGAAHGWAPDAEPFRIESLLTADSKGQGGKAAVWRASFASALQHSAKPYEWSGTDASGCSLPWGLTRRGGQLYGQQLLDPALSGRIPQSGFRPGV